MKKTLLCFLLLCSNLFFAQVTSVNVCGKEPFNLTTLNTDFIGNLNPAETTVSFFLSQDDALNNTNLIANPTSFLGSTGTIKVFGRINNNGAITTNYANLTTIPPVTLSASHKPILCYGETTSLNLTASGGGGSYEYSINGSPFSNVNNYDNLPAGVYNIQVLSANSVCTTSSLTYTIPEPNVLVATYSKNNQNITVNAIGGTVPYQYSIDGVNYQVANVFTNLSPGTYNVFTRDSEGCSAMVTATVDLPLVANLTIIKLMDCVSNAELFAHAIGGQYPYTYSLNGGPFSDTNYFTNIAPGNYVVAAKDASNMVVYANSVTIEAPLQVNATATNTSILCTGGDASITVTASGGKAPFQYSINNGAYSSNPIFSTLKAGTYNLTVKDANGCQYIFAHTITEPAIVNGDVSIEGQTVSVIDMQGGTGIYEYAIDNGGFQNSNVFTNVAPGDHTVRVKDSNNCEPGTFSITVEGQNTLVSTAVITKQIDCMSGASVVVNATGGQLPYVYSINGSAYQASNIFVGLTAGTYSVTVKDAANAVSSPNTITINSLVPIAAVATDAGMVCARETTSITVTAVGGQAPYEYSINNGLYTNSNVFSSVGAGIHNLQVRDSNGCLYMFQYTVVPPTPIYPEFIVDGHNLTINGQAGTAPYLYSVDDSAFQSNNVYTNLSTGIHVIRIKDSKGCESFVFTVTIEDQSPLTSIATVLKNIDCISDASITVAATGGQTPYSYSINGNVYQSSNTFAGLAAGNYSVTVKDAANTVSSTNTITIPTYYELVTTATVRKAIDCTSNAVITATTTGGNAPYIYSFDGGNTYVSNNTFNGATAGTYTIVTKDGYGCTSTAILTVDPLPNLTSTAVIVKTVDCSNGTIKVNASGGTTPYLYSINNEAYTSSSLFYKPAGTYTLNVKDASGCISSTVLTLAPYIPVTIYATVTNVMCTGTSDGSITIALNGGVAPYTYTLDGTTFQSSNVFNNLAAGNYTIGVKDSRGCLRTNDVVIHQPSNLAITSVVNDVTCKGQNNGSILLNVTGGNAPYLYSKDGLTYVNTNNFSSLNPGTYTFFVKDSNGCIAPYNATITEPEFLTLNADIKSINNDDQIGGLIKLNAIGGKAPYLYSVKNDTRNITLSVDQNIKIYSGLSEGSYTISAVDANGCRVTLNNITVTISNPIAINAVKTPLSCLNSNASLSVNPSGGVPPYLYSYDKGVTFTSNNTGLTNLPTGTHSILMKDAIGNEAQSHLIVKSYIPVTTTTSVSYETANGSIRGLIKVNSSGGTAPYTYTIKRSATNEIIYENATSVVYSGLPAGTYSITSKDSNGCVSNSSETTITFPTPILITLSDVSSISCENSTESLTMNASGGTAPYTYSFNSGQTYSTINKVTGLASGGNYIFYVKDAVGNVSWVSYKTKAYTSLNTVWTQINVRCFGSPDGSIIVTPTGGTTPYSYSLNNSSYSNSNVFTNLAAGEYNIKVKDAAGCVINVQVMITQPTLLSSSINATNATNIGNDGKITVIPSGGSAPYIYSLRNDSGQIIIPQQVSNIFNGLTSGSYVVQVIDAQACIIESNIIKISTSLLSATATVTPISCVTSTATITVTATGGSGSYQYSIDNGITYSTSNIFGNLQPGNYAINVKDSQNFVYSFVMTVEALSPLNSTASVTSNVRCKGSNTGSATLAIAGGKAPYQVSLDGGAYYYSASNVITYDSLNAGLHKLDVKDTNGCVATTSIAITEPATGLIANLTVENQTVTVQATGGTGAIKFAISPDLYLFTTNNVFTNLAPGNYSILVQDTEGCVVIFNVLIDPPAPVVDGKESVEIEFTPGQTLADLVVEGKNIKWYSTAGSTTDRTTGKTNETPLPLTTVLVNGTTYYASQTINGVESKERLAVTAKVKGSLSTPDHALSGFKYYPNPVEHILNVSNTVIIDEIEIISASGKFILSKKINDTNSEIDLSNVSSGLYFLKVKSEGKTKTIKIVKK